MLMIGNEKFHFLFLMERTLYSARYYIAFLCFGFLYFAIVEGIWGAGLGKWLKGLRVVRTNGRRPGIGRALIRIVVPILCIEVIRIPILLATISPNPINQLALTWPEIAVYMGTAYTFPWIPVLASFRARRENGFATLWDLASGTRVVIKPEGALRQSIEPAAPPDETTEAPEMIGPYQVISELVPGEWIVARDPVLRRQAWLLRRGSLEPSLARRNLSRHGRLRWLQKVEKAETTWDVYEATKGVPFPSLVEGGKLVSWSTLRHWLHDLTTELWAATGDQTLPDELSLDHVWITTQGNAVLLDEPWPEVKEESERTRVGSIDGQQRFLNSIAAYVESTSLPLHARPVLQNLEGGKFGKLSFLTGILRGLLDKPSEVSKGIRAGAIFMLSLYIWILLFVGFYTGEGFWEPYDSLGGILLVTTMLVLGVGALIQLAEVPFRTTLGHSLFGLAVVNADGERAERMRLLVRWAIAWIPLLVPMSLVAVLMNRGELTVAFSLASVLLLLWMGAAVYSVIHPNRGLHDRFSGTWVVRH
jgi:uncharacterized RDD family membrane protein YckC